jgi:hypothetical protein
MSFVILVCTLALVASPHFLNYYAERLLGWPQAVYAWFDPWLPIVMILASALITFALPWIIDSFSDPDR